MPNNLKNWKFRDVEKFLTKRGFILTKINSSHHFYRGVVDNVLRQVHVQKHPGETLKLRLMKEVIADSGISKEEWFGER